MKTSRFSDSQILAILKQASNGVTVTIFAGNRTIHLSEGKDVCPVEYTAITPSP